MTQETTPDTRAVSVFNDTDPRAVLNLIPPGAVQKIKDAFQKKPELFEMDERTLLNFLSKKEARGSGPTPTDNRLRLSFWNEFDRAQTQKTKMSMTNVYSAICTQQFWDNFYLASPEKVAWLLTRPASYEQIMEEGLNFGINKMREFLDLPIIDKKGNLNLKLMELQAKIVAMFDVRVHGAAIQKIEQKSMQLNVHTSDKAVAKAMMGDSMDDIEKRLKELEKLDKSKQVVPAPKELTEELGDIEVKGTHIDEV